MNLELKRQMENFVIKSEHYVQIAAYIKAWKLSIVGVRHGYSIPFPPNAEFIQQVLLETILPAWRYYIKEQTESLRKIRLSLENRLIEIENIKINELISYKKLFVDCMYLSIIYLKFAQSNKLKKLYNEYVSSTEDIEIFQNRLAHDPFIVMTHNADRLGREIDKQLQQMEGYWISNIERLKIGQKGGEVTERKQFERINELKKFVEQEESIDDKNYIIPKPKWEKEFKKIFGYHGVSYPTKKKYRQVVELMLSWERGKEINIKIKK